MSHYSDNPASVRVDFFKESGKWYATEMVTMTLYEGLIHEDFKKALKDKLYDESKAYMRYEGMRAVCLEPYHKHSHPIMIIVENWKEL